MDSNIYGVQRVPETHVTSGKQVAGATAMAAAQGAAAGASFGPWGAAVGGVVGGAAGYLGASAGRTAAKLANERDKSQNKFVESLNGRALRSQDYVRAQARYGMKNKKRYESAEIEGDGSGDFRHGIGEIHTDKNYNIKTLAKGSPTHEEGGHPIHNLEKGDTVFPTQNNEEEYNKVLSSIKRYKMNGDKRAKKYLDMKRDQLPTDADYEAAKGKTYAKGKAPGDGDADLMDYMKTQYPGASKQTLDMMVSKYKQKYANPIPQPSDADPADVNKNVPANTGGAATRSQSTDTKESDWEVSTDHDKAYNYRRKVDSKTGQSQIQIQKKGAKDWTDVTNDPKVNQHVIENKVWGGSPANPDDKIEEPNSSTALPAKEGAPSTSAPVTSTSPAPETPTPESNPAFDYPGAVNSKAKQIAEGTATPSTDQEADAARRYQLNDKITSALGNAGKYASVADNLITGMSPVQKTTRREFQPDLYKYTDRSATQRRAVAEQRNFTGQSLRGKGLSAGQEQSYLGQVGSQYLAANEAINEREGQRADEINMANTGMMNEAKLRNIALANEYDTWDLQNQAARKRYLDTAMADISELAQLGEQKRYMKSRDEKADQIQKQAISLVGTTDFGAENPDKWDQIDLRGSSRDREINMYKPRVATPGFETENTGIMQNRYGLRKRYK